MNKSTALLVRVCPVGSQQHYENLFGIKHVKLKLRNF